MYSQLFQDESQNHEQQKFITHQHYQRGGDRVMAWERNPQRAYGAPFMDGPQHQPRDYFSAVELSCNSAILKRAVHRLFQNKENARGTTSTSPTTSSAER